MSSFAREERGAAVTPAASLPVPRAPVSLINGMDTLDNIFFYGLIVAFISIGVYNAIRDKLHVQGKRDHDVNSADFQTSRATLSLFASTLSASLLIRNPANVYYHGPQHWIGVLSLPIAILFAAYVTMPVLMRGSDKTALAYLDTRFGKLVLALALIFQVMEILLMTSFWIAVPLRTLNRVSKLSSSINISIVTIVVTIYSALGGMRAIQKVDLIQLLVIAAVNIALVSKGTATVGGFDQVFVDNTKNGRAYFTGSLNPFTEVEDTFVVIVINLTFMVIRYSINQSVINRYSPAKDLQTARSVLLYQIPLMGSAHLTSIALGLVIFSFYRDCDPLLTERITEKDDVVGLYFEDLLGYRTGLVGLFSGSLLSSTLSATSSNLNGLASIVNEHVIKHEFLERLHKRMGTGTKTKHLFYIVLRLTVAVVALTSALLLIQADVIFDGNLTTSLTALVMFQAPVMGVFMMGFFNKRATRSGALIGLVAGFLVGVTIFAMHIWTYVSRDAAGASVTVCSQYYEKIRNGTRSANNTTSTDAAVQRPLRLAYGMGGMITMLVTLIIGSLFSFVEKQTPEEQKKNTDLMAFAKAKDE